MGFLSSFVGNLTGGLLGESDAERAADQSAAISAQAREDILGELDNSWEDVQSWLTPYLEVGQTALGAYKSAIGAAPEAPVFEGFDFDWTKLEDNPAYQFVRDQGLQAMDRVQAKNRALTSGNRITATLDYASGLASKEYQNEFMRQLQTTQENNRTRALQYDAEGATFDRNLSTVDRLYSTGLNTATNLAGFRERLAGSKQAAHSNYAAEQGAALLIPAQEKMSFVNNLISTAGTYAGTR